MDNTTIIRGFGVLNRTFLNYISKSISGKDISYSDSIFLVNIGDQEGANQEEISNLLAIDNAAVARSVKNMEQKGYVRTTISKDDKRVKRLYLTDSGQELYRFMQDLNNQWIDYVMGDVSDGDIRNFIRTLDQISAKARRYEEHPQ